MNLTTTSIESKPTRSLPIAGLLVGGAAAALAITAIATDDVGTDAPAPAVVVEEQPAPPAQRATVDNPVSEPVFVCEPQRIDPVPC